MSAAPARFAVRADALRWRGWDDGDEGVVFDVESARTHLLSPAASAVMQTLLASHPQPLGVGDLAACLMPQDATAQERDADARALFALLQELASLGLVHPAGA